MQKKSTFCFFLALVCLLSPKINSQTFIQNKQFLSTESVSVPYRIYPSPYYQLSTAIFASPVNPDFIVAASISGEDDGYRAAFFVSTNGGLNWSGTPSIKDPGGAKILTIGDINITIGKDSVILMSFFGVHDNAATVSVSRSTNKGLTWSIPEHVENPGVYPDKNRLATDNNPASPYYGRSYLIWRNYVENDESVRFSHSLTGGAWTSSVNLSSSSVFHYPSTEICVGTDGTVYASWMRTPLGYGFGKSTNGGVNWSIVSNAITARYPGDVIENENAIMHSRSVMDIDKTNGPRSGWLYIAGGEKDTLSSPAIFDFDLVLYRSTNSGSSWSGFRINQENTGQYNYHLEPCMNVDEYGGLNVVYLDTRNTPARDSFEVYLSRSVDGGTTFHDYKVSNYKFKFKPQPGLFGLDEYAGANIGVTSSGTKIFPLWFDTKSGIYQATTAKIELSMKISAIPEGFLNPLTGQMNSADTLRVYLRSSVPPYNRADSSKSVIDPVTFKGDFFFKNANPGNYFLECAHRNSITTWSAVPVSYELVPDEDYYFTPDSTMAYDDNMISKGGKWCFYSGDVNRDAVVSINDIILTYNDASVFATGYINADLTGDGIVNLNDVSIAFNNSSRFITVRQP